MPAHSRPSPFFAGLLRRCLHGADVVVTAEFFKGAQKSLPVLKSDYGSGIGRLDGVWIPSANDRLGSHPVYHAVKQAGA